MKKVCVGYREVYGCFSCGRKVRVDPDTYREGRVMPECCSYCGSKSIVRLKE